LKDIIIRTLRLASHPTPNHYNYYLLEFYYTKKSVPNSTNRGDFLTTICSHYIRRGNITKMLIRWW